MLQQCQRRDRLWLLWLLLPGCRWHCVQGGGGAGSGVHERLTGQQAAARCLPQACILGAGGLQTARVRPQAGLMGMVKPQTRRLACHIWLSCLLLHAMAFVHLRSTHCVLTRRAVAAGVCLQV